MSYGSQELYLRLLIKRHYSHVDGLVPQLIGNGGLGLLFALDEPGYLPFFRVDLHGNGISVFDLRATLLALSLVVQETSVFIIPYVLLAILSTIEPSDCFSPYPVHKRSITPCLDLFDVVLSDLISFYGVFGHQYVPCSSTIFKVPVAYFVESFVVGVGLVCSKPSWGCNGHGKLLLLLFPPLLKVLESFEYIGDGLVLSTKFLLAFLHLLLNLTSLCFLLGYFLFETAIFHLQSINLLLQPLKLKCKDSLRVQFLLGSLNDTLIVLNCIAEFSLNIEQDVPIAQLNIVSRVSQEVAEEILGSAKEEIDVFILLDGQQVYSRRVLGKGSTAGNIEMEGACKDGEVELVAADGEVVAVHVLKVHLRWLLIQNRGVYMWEKCI